MVLNAFRNGGPFSGYSPRSNKVFGIICVSKNNRLLLVRGRVTGIWSLPKGHFKGNELAHECALRELYEETGIILNKNNYKCAQKLYAGEYFIYKIDEEIAPYIHDTIEISEAGWYSMDDIGGFHCNVDLVNMMKKISAGKMLV